MTGRDLYDQLGSSIVNNIGVSSNNSWTLNAFIDGEPATLAKADIIRSNTDGVLGTAHPGVRGRRQGAVHDRPRGAG